MCPRCARKNHGKMFLGFDAERVDRKKGVKTANNEKRGISRSLTAGPVTGGGGGGRGFVRTNPLPRRPKVRSIGKKLKYALFDHKQIIVKITEAK